MNVGNDSHLHDCVLAVRNWLIGNELEDYAEQLIGLVLLRCHENRNVEAL